MSRNFSKWAKDEHIIDPLARGLLLLGNDIDNEYEECNRKAVLYRWWKDTQIEASKPPRCPVWGLCEAPGYSAVIDTSRGSFSIWIQVAPEDELEYQEGFLFLHTYNPALCAVVVFSAKSPSSLEDAESKWIPMLKQLKPCPPFVLLATDSGSDDEWVVDRDEATAVANRVGALENRVFECTLENGDRVLKAAFEAVVVAGLDKRREQRSSARRGRRCEIQ